MTVSISPAVYLSLAQLPPIPSPGEPHSTLKTHTEGKPWLSSLMPNEAAGAIGTTAPEISKLITTQQRTMF